MATMPTVARQLLLRGHEVISHTAAFSDGRHCCLVYLLDPFADRKDLKVFKAYAEGCDEAESRALSQALMFLEYRDVDPGATVASHTSVDISNRKVDIFCDLVAEGRYQAFPFLRRADGSRSLIMQFHLKEAITAETPGEALARCVSRLTDHFDSLGEAAEQTPGG